MRTADDVLACVKSVMDETWKEYLSIPQDHTDKKYVTGKWIQIRTLYFRLRFETAAGRGL